MSQIVDGEVSEDEDNEDEEYDDDTVSDEDKDNKKENNDIANNDGNIKKSRKTFKSMYKKERCFNYDCVDYMGRGALHLAVDKEHAESAELLMSVVK